MAILSPSRNWPITRRFTSLLWIWLGIVAMFTAAGRDVLAQSVSREYQVKAAFLFNFSQFVQWPPAAFPGMQSPLVIGIIGDDPFGDYLDQLVRGEKVNHHPLVVQRFRRVEEIKTCHILFVSQSEARRWDQILPRLKGRTILTVGDVEGFAQREGMICFVTEKNKVRFIINVEAARAANLTISSKLLRVAEIIPAGKA
jgi:hypothetical protein